MKSRTLTDRQIVRLAKRGQTLLSHAQIMAKCLPAELGTSVADGFADSAITSGIEGLERMVRIKIALHIRGNARRRSALTLALDALRESARCFLRRGNPPDPVHMAKAISAIEQAIKEEP